MIEHYEIQTRRKGTWLKTTTHHGCGRFWLRMFLHFDTHTEVVEGWHC